MEFFDKFEIRKEIVNLLQRLDLIEPLKFLILKSSFGKKKRIENIANTVQKSVAAS